MGWQLYVGTALAVLLVASVALTRRPVLERALDRMVAKVGLAPTPEVRPMLVRRVRAMRIGEIIGCAAGVALGGLLVAHGSGLAPLPNLAVQGVVVAGGAAGIAVGGAVAARGLPARGVRVARDRAVRVADYISPVERGAVVLATLLALATGLVPAIGGRAEHPGSIAAASIAVLGWAAFEIAARRIVVRPQPAGTALELAWDDALRSTAIRRMAGAAAAVSVYAVVAGAWFGAHALLPGEPAGQVVLGALLGLIAVLVAARFWLLLVAPGRYFRDRLWPDTVPYAPPLEVRR